MLLLLLSNVDFVTAWQPEKCWKQQQTMKSISHNVWRELSSVLWDRYYIGQMLIVQKSCSGKWNYCPAIAGKKCERRTVRSFVVAVSSIFQAAMQWRIQRGSTTTITHRIPVQRQRCTTKVRSISGGDVRGGSFFLHSLLIDCVMRQQVLWVKIQQRFGDSCRLAALR